MGHHYISEYVVDSLYSKWEFHRRFIVEMILTNVGITNKKPTISELHFQGRFLEYHKFIECTFDKGEFSSLGEHICMLEFER